MNNLQLELESGQDQLDSGRRWNWPWRRAGALCLALASLAAACTDGEVKEAKGFSAPWEHVYTTGPKEVIIQFTGGKPLRDASPGDYCAHDYKTDVTEKSSEVIVEVKGWNPQEPPVGEVECTLEGYSRCVEVDLVVPVGSREFINPDWPKQRFQAEPLPPDTECTPDDRFLMPFPH